MKKEKNEDKNRNIKFRIWCAKHREMLYLNPMYGSSIFLKTNGTHWGVFKEDYKRGAYANDLFGDILMQWTGLKDKNGKKIYEGDILKFNDEAWSSSYTSCGTEWDSWDITNYGVVGFDEDAARFDFVKYKFHESQVEADIHENHDIEFADFVKDQEIVGNIYENPELMKVEGEYERQTWI